MKKFFLLALGIYMLVAFGLIIFTKEKANEISILSKTMTYSRIITKSDETIEFPLYFSQEDSFLTVLGNIDVARLTSDTNEISLIPVDITPKETDIKYKDKTYILYMFAFKIEDFNLQDINLEFKEAYLNLTYKNEVKFNFDIGEVNILFNEIINPSHIEMTRMYATVDNSDNLEYVSGIVIGIKKHTVDNVVITKLNTFLGDSNLDLCNSIKINEAPNMDEDIEDILGESYQNVNLNFCTTSNLSLEDEALYFIPMNYKILKTINRFPLELTYKINDIEYQYYIDDFLFFSTNYNLGGSDGTISENIYKYQ